MTESLKTMPRPLLALGCHQCRWAVNRAARGEAHLFCGAPAAVGRRYCQHHLAMAYRPKEGKPKG